MKKIRIVPVDSPPNPLEYSNINRYYYIKTNAAANVIGNDMHFGALAAVSLGKINGLIQDPWTLFFKIEEYEE